MLNLFLALVAIFGFISLVFAILHVFLTIQVTKGKGEWDRNSSDSSH